MFLPIIAANIIGFVASILGCFVVWRRLSYFTDALAHSSLLGVAFALIFDLNLTFCVLFVSCLVAVLLHYLEGVVYVARDALVGLFAHSFVAMGITMVAVYELYQASIDPHAGHYHGEEEDESIDLHEGHNHGSNEYGYDESHGGILFGDITSVVLGDILPILIFGIFALVILCRYWRSLFATSVSREIAVIELGSTSKYVPLLFGMLIALIVALAIEIIGALLIASMLVVPPIAARTFAKTPEQMGIISAVVGVLSVNLGLAVSFGFGLPTGAAIIVFTFIFAVASLLLQGILHLIVMQRRG